MIDNNRIIIWGTNRRAAMYYKWLSETYSIVAFVSTNSISGQIYGMPVVEPQELLDMNFDCIVLTAEENELDSYREKVIAINSAYADKCFSIDEIVAKDDRNKYLEYTNVRQLRVIKELLSASDNEISDYDWMYEKVVEYGIFCFNQEHWHEADSRINWAVYGLQQIPKEFASFCNYISGLRIDSAAEVGVYRGRSTFFICAILARNNPGLRYRMIDIYDRIDDFDVFYEYLPQLEKCIPSSSDDYRDESYDFVFIDADHSYDSSINDYNNLGENANVIVCFHDIYAHEYDNENGGTVRTWKEVMERTEGKEHLVFSEYPDKWMGIGCVMK